MKQTSVLVGNSSSGIREGAFIGTPVVNIGTTSTGNTSYTVSLRKVKRIGGDYATGDGGWEYQILRNTNHGYTVHMTIMGVHDGWVWVV